MQLRYAIAASALCAVLSAAPQAVQAQQTVVGPLRVGGSAAPATAPSPVPLKLPDMATADYQTGNRAGAVPATPRPRSPAAASPAPSAIQPVPASRHVVPVNPAPMRQAAGATAGHVEPDDRPRNAVAVYVGRSATTNFTQMLYAPWTIEFEDTALLAVSYNRHLYTVLEHLDIEAEVNVGKRFGNADEWEFNTGILLRWTWFPWNDTVKTTLGISLFGPSYATGISDTEKDKSGNDKGNRWLNFFAPELTFADPENPDLEFVFRLHHRSGIFGIYEGVDGGSTFISTGLRYRF